MGITGAVMMMMMIRWYLVDGIFKSFVRAGQGRVVSLLLPRKAPMRWVWRWEWGWGMGMGMEEGRREGDYDQRKGRYDGQERV